MNASDPDFGTTLYYYIIETATNINRQALLAITPVGAWTDVTLLPNLRLDYEYQPVVRIRVVVQDSLTSSKLEDDAYVSPDGCMGCLATLDPVGLPCAGCQPWLFSPRPLAWPMCVPRG